MLALVCSSWKGEVRHSTILDDTVSLWVSLSFTIRSMTKEYEKVFIKKIEVMDYKMNKRCYYISGIILFVLTLLYVASDGALDDIARVKKVL